MWIWDGIQYTGILIYNKKQYFYNVVYKLQYLILLLLFFTYVTHADDAQINSNIDNIKRRLEPDGNTEWFIMCGYSGL